MKFTEYSVAKTAFDDGSIWTCSDDDLKQCAAMLSTQFIKNDGIRQNLGSMSSMISDELTRRFIHSLERDKRKTEKLFLILAIGSLLIAVASIVISLVSLWHQLGGKAV